MARIFRIAEMYHQVDASCEDDLVGTVAADVLAILTDHAICNKTTGDDAEALTLADGKNGQLLVINLVTAGGGVGTMTPTTTTGFNTIAFTDAGDQAVLLFVNEIIGWIIISTFGLTAQPTVT